MTNAATFFSELKKAVLLEMNTAMPCTVLAFNETTSTARLQPLFRSKEVGYEPENLPVLEDVPVLFQKYKVSGVVTEMKPFLAAGDVVQVVFNQRAIDDVKTAKPHYPNQSRKFSIHDAVVVGVWP